MARLKTSLRVSAIMKRAQSAGAFAAILRRGDADAGAIWVIVRQGAELYRYSEQMSMSGAREWFRDGPFNEAELNLRTQKSVDRDPDLWLVEIEDAHGRSFLDGETSTPPSEAELAAKALFRGR